MSRPLRRFFSISLFQALFLASLGLTLWLDAPQDFSFLGAPAIAQSPPPSQLVQAGVEAYGQGQYASAIGLWQQALATYPPDAAWSQRALVNENLARTYGNVGDTTAALDAWAAAANAYQQSGDRRQFGRMLTEQAQVYTHLGQYQRAIALLCGGEPIGLFPEGSTQSNEVAAAGAALRCSGGSFAIAEVIQDIPGQAAAMGSLAEALRLSGTYEAAKVLMQGGLQLVQTQALSQFEAPLLNSLGNLSAQLFQIADRRAEAANLLNKPSIAEMLRQEAQQNNQAAIRYFTNAIAAAQGQAASYTELQSHLSLLSLYQSQGDQPAMVPSQRRLGQLITQISARRETAYAAITLAQTYQKSRDFDCSTYQEVADVQTWLEVGREIATSIQDNRAASFALGELGHLAECRGQLATAVQLTNQAQLAASDALESADSLYLWEWQRGRLYLQEQQYEEALAAYGQAIATLESIRTDILTADRELQFDFRDTVEPIYRQYVELQLTAPVEVASTQPVALSRDSNRLSNVLGTVDSLRLAELQNFFGDDCVLVSSEEAREQLLATDPGTAVISSVVLGDRTALIASFADGTPQIEWVEDTAALRQGADDFRRSLKRFRILSAYDKSYAQALYDSLIRPFEDTLAANNIDTLVFVQDGFLRNVPMAALHDGTQYLIQRYAVATTPSLGLTATGRDRPKQLRALAVGLSQATRTERGQAFSELRFVPSELASVSEQLPGSKVLLNDDFTVDQLEVALQETRYPILHLATHGQFSTIPEDTFVVTGSPDPDTAGELTFGQLEALLRQSAPSADPLDLITLTACETATGDDRATLGLAGVAIRAGARSAIASLWKINDETAAQLVNAFYENLKDPTLSKAQSLQAAQQAAIAAVPETENPGYWAPLILVGNWQ